MFTCYNCKRKCNTTLTLIKHMRSACSITAKIKGYRCGEHNCFRHFTTVVSLRKHLEKEHAPKNNSVCVSENDEHLIDSPSTSESVSQNRVQSNSISDIGHEIPSQITLSQSFNNLQQDIQNENRSSTIQLQLANFLSTIYSKHGIPRNTVQTVSDRRRRQAKELLLDE